MYFNICCEKITGKNTTIEAIDGVCLEYGVMFVDDSQLDGFVGNHSKGYDSNHLHSEEASEFTKTLINQLRREGCF